MPRRIFILIFCLIVNPPALAMQSTCYGKTHKGRLENGVRLPVKGENYMVYSRLGVVLGRTYVHSRVKQVIVEAYAKLYKNLATKVFQYAETGFRRGGPFKPHRSHQNGLSVDFMVPVKDAKGRSRHLPIHPFNRWGYDIEFDARGRYADYQLDFDALGAHLFALHRTARKNNMDLSRVFFDPRLQPMLFSTVHGDYLKRNIVFNKKTAWVRHDEHYHVDFKLKCEKLSYGKTH